MGQHEMTEAEAREMFDAMRATCSPEVTRAANVRILAAVKRVGHYTLSDEQEARIAATFKEGDRVRDTVTLEVFDVAEIATRADGTLQLYDATGNGSPARDCTLIAEHNCDEWAGPVQTDGPLGHGWACGVCGNFLQAG